MSDIKSPVISHALVFGRRVDDLRMWCDLEAKDARSIDMIATMPEHVTCPRCITNMETAHKQLSEWAPRLVKTT